MNLEAIFGIYSYHGYMFQILLAEALFLPFLQRRKRFWLRLAIGLPLYLVSSWLGANLLQLAIPQLTSFTIFLLSFALGFVLFENRFKSLLFLYAGAQIIQNLSHNIEGIILLPLFEHFNLLGQFFLSVGVMIVVYVAAYFLIVRSLRNDANMVVPTRWALFLPVFSAAFCYLVQTLMKELLPNPHWVVVLPLIFCDVITLGFAYFFASYLSEGNKTRELETLIAQTDGYYEMVGANIEAINLKAHDLKHYIATVEAGSSEQEALSELKKAVEDYETSSKTGNRALDNVLSNYLLLFSKENIPFSYAVDAEALAFLRPSDLATMFGNLLSNALEAERKIAEKSKVYVGLKAFKKGGMVSIHVENYWPEEIAFKRGLPASTKEDSLNHGFGVKSISYVAGKYGGTVNFVHIDNVFEANVLFPSRAK